MSVLLKNYFNATGLNPWILVIQFPAYEDVSNLLFDESKAILMDSNTQATSTFSSSIVGDRDYSAASNTIAITLGPGFVRAIQASIVYDTLHFTSTGSYLRRSNSRPVTVADTITPVQIIRVRKWFLFFSLQTF